MAKRTRFYLVKRQVIWWPTGLGWICATALLCVPLLLWWYYGEGFLSLTVRRSATVLVVEGWIGTEGVDAAAFEFRTGGYDYVIATGGPPLTRFGQRGSYANIAASELIIAGVPPEKIIAAPAKSSAKQRTFQSALAVRKALREHAIHPVAINVFTLGVHARRSHTVFSKVHHPDIQVGVIAWIPSEYKTGEWWSSSERTKDLMTETTGELFEVLFNSGRSLSAE